MPRNEQLELRKMDCASKKGSALTPPLHDQSERLWRRSGTIKSEDGILALPLALPKELGGKGGVTNSEQLFAAGNSAWLANAVTNVTRAQAVQSKRR